MPDQELEPILDIETRSIRGRACPECGGKIIPSNTAVFQGQADSSSLFVSWQCERCGHLEVFEKPSVKTDAKHGKVPGAAKTATVAGNGNSSIDGAGGQSFAVPSISAPSDLPPDVQKLLEIMGNPHGYQQG